MTRCDRCTYCGANVVADGERLFLAFHLSDRWRALARSDSCPLSPTDAHAVSASPYRF